jgi:N-acetylglucosaminyl-diphospho-decaprenol L-rhamnosyltransferase
MWQHGWRVAYVPQSQMIHHHQRASARGLFSRSTRIHLQSMIRFFRKHYLNPPLHVSHRAYLE